MLNSKDTQIVLDAIEEIDLTIISHIREFDDNALLEMLKNHSTMSGIIIVELNIRKTRGETI